VLHSNLKGSFILGELSELPNIGKEVERQLNKVGIFTYDELKDIGAEQAWLKIQEIDDSACIHRLLALEGAIQAVKKAELPQERKADLKDFYNLHKGK
jgi:DNA transformation protein and related proteins